MNNSLEVGQNVKIISSDNENSGQDSWLSMNSFGNQDQQSVNNLNQANKVINTSHGSRSKHKKDSNHKTLNEASLWKVDWLIGFEEASNKNLFDCLWLCTEKINEESKQKLKDIVKRHTMKSKRDKAIQEMHPEPDISQEAYYKKNNIKITTVVSTILKNAGIIGNPIQSMMARNIRHFENITFLKFDKKTDKDTSMAKNTSKELDMSTEFEKNEKLNEVSKIALSQASKYKRVNNYVLAFGFSNQTKQLFVKAERDKVEIINDEEFDLLRYLKIG
jgi:hypothetical protein